ncbi:MAG: hypothetical protein ACE37B_19635 [Ilumatobacter sp.]|uniref:hypothetical protein n=1 Tax=Ilumatobacter sp. TaxID=1967498 RepID=UPI003919C704
MRGTAILVATVMTTAATVGADGDSEPVDAVERSPIEIIESIVPEVLEDTNPEPTVLPANLADGYQIATTDGLVTINVPGADGPAVDLGDGATSYETGEVDTDTVLLQTTSGDVRVLKVIAGTEAPSRFEFSVSDPSIKLVTTPTGHVEFRRDGIGIATIAPPWAFDSSQHPVSTRYIVDGSSFFLEVDHQSAEVSYPVVADPIPAVIWIWGARFVLGAIVSKATKWVYERRGYTCPWWASYWNVWFGCYKRAG